MKNILTYKDFIGSVQFSTEDELFFGKIEGINDLITFEGSSVQELKKSFEDAVDDYIKLCTELKKNPYKSFKGSLNIRIKPELHKLAHQSAVLKGISLNQLIQHAIQNEVNGKDHNLDLI